MNTILLNELRALTWKEPYASLMFHGKIETRKWNTNYRGLVLICCGRKRFSPSEVQKLTGNDPQILSSIAETLTKPTPHMVSKVEGYAIGVGKLVDCRTMRPDDEEKAFVNYDPELYAHIYMDVTSIDPVPFKGKQGWTKLSIDYLDNLKFHEQ